MSEALPYRQATYTPVPAWRRWWPLAMQEFRSLFRTKGGVAVFCVCLVPGLVRLVMMLILFGVLNFGPPGLRTRIPQRAEGLLNPETVDFYLEPVLAVMPGMVMALLLTSLVVARAIARDRMTNALELYWTRGISPLAYLFAKWVGCCMLLATITVVVPLLLWVTGVFLAEDPMPLLARGPDLALALFGTLVVTGLWTAICILISATCAAPNTAMMSWSMLLVGSTAIGFVLGRALQAQWLTSCLGVWTAGGVLARAIAGIPQRGVSVVGSAATFLVLLTIFGFLARRRLRLAEAVG